MLKINFFTNFEICYEIINIFLIFFAAASTLNSCWFSVNIFRCVLLVVPNTCASCAPFIVCGAHRAQLAHGYLSDAQKCAQCAQTQIPCADSSENINIIFQLIFIKSALI